MEIFDMLRDLQEGAYQPALRPFTEDQVFVDKVYDFERQYGQEWYAFKAQFESGRLVGCSEEEKLDYAEWFMLCVTFEDQLTERLTNMAMPPSHTFEFSFIERPEKSGLSSFGKLNLCSWRLSIG